jgi:hypothetical protein
VAIDAARSTARRIIQAGEQVGQEIDLQTIRLITEARLSFLDLDKTEDELEQDVNAPIETGRAVEYAPEEFDDENPAPRSSDVARAIELD